MGTWKAHKYFSEVGDVDPSQQTVRDETGESNKVHTNEKQEIFEYNNK